MSRYSGPSRRLVISFDVGTTFSGMSYCILDPGEVPEIRNITKYPGHEHAAGSTKIPTIMYYNREGEVKLSGAETQPLENVIKAQDEEWMKVEWFKLRLRPKSMPSALSISTLPPLPENKSIVHVFADFLAYLLSCAKTFICETHATLSSLWEQLRQDAIFIISHPNGWEGVQQAKLRRAAVLAGFIPDTLEGRARVNFVTEGEASLHYCLRGKFIDMNNKGFIVADLGGGTLDFSAYEVTQPNPLGVREVAPANCELEGATFVTRRMGILLQEKLRHSAYAAENYLELITDCFDDAPKKQFRSADDNCLVRFGTLRDRDPKHNIRGGVLTIPGVEVAKLFEPAVEAALAAIRSQVKSSPILISSVYVVGGFSSNPYLTSQLKSQLSEYNITISTPDGQAAKAVADGALSFYVDNFVTSRVATASYCIPCNFVYDASDVEHRKRSKSSYILPSGRRLIKGGLTTAIQKGTSVTKETEFRTAFFGEVYNLSDIKSVSNSIEKYCGEGVPPSWTDQIVDSDSLIPLCLVEADVSSLKNTVKASLSSHGTTYWSYDYEIVILFGAPEIKAQIAWRENGVERRGPAKVVYDDDELDSKDDE